MCPSQLIQVGKKNSGHGLAISIRPGETDLHFFSVNWWSKQDFPTPISPVKENTEEFIASEIVCNRY